MSDMCDCGCWDCNCPGLQEEYDEMRAQAEAAAGPPPLPDTETQLALLDFAKRMGAELMRNRDKGDWTDVPLERLVGPNGELMDHVRKLLRAVEHDPARAWEHAADVGICALMAARAVERQALATAAAGGEGGE